MRLDLTIPLTIIFVIAVQALAPPPIIETKKFLSPPPEQIEYFHMGFRESIADSLWLRWIQDNDFCQTYFESKQSEPLVRERSEHEDRLTGNPRHKICDVSWGFKMLDAITRLAPRFMMAYMAGGSTLSILVEDYEGASIIFDRGLRAYPNDWQLLYRAAYHYQFDRKDLPKAAAALTRAADAGGPPWTKSLAARLYTKAGQLELGLQTLHSYRETVKENPEVLKKIDDRIAELKHQIENN